MFLTLIDITPARARVNEPNEPSCHVLRHSNVIGWVIQSSEPCEDGFWTGSDETQESSEIIEE